MNLLTAIIRHMNLNDLIEILKKQDTKIRKSGKTPGVSAPSASVTLRVHGKNKAKFLKLANA